MATVVVGVLRGTLSCRLEGLATFLCSGVARPGDTGLGVTATGSGARIITVGVVATGSGLVGSGVLAGATSRAGSTRGGLYVLPLELMEPLPLPLSLLAQLFQSKLPRDGSTYPGLATRTGSGAAVVFVEDESDCGAW